MLTFLLLTGFGCAAKDEAAITIDHIRISAEEFEAAFQASRFAPMGQEGRKAFLENYISLKLMLKEAEETGLDKDPQLLADVQSFWEKALFRLALARKSQSLASGVSVSEQEVLGYYQQNLQSHFAGKGLPEVYEQIKWRLLQEKQIQVIAAWTGALKAKAKIKIDSASLGLKE
jgi:hypothetical protein